MICRLNTNEERREKRLLFFKDDVFCIAHSAIRNVDCVLCLEELFCTAEKLSHHLLINEIVDEELIDYEIEDFERVCDDRNVAFLVLTIAFVKLCALRKVNPLAADVAKALVHRCQNYDEFNDMLKALAEAEKKYIVNKGRINLFEYELKTVVSEYSDSQRVDEIINSYINSVLDCDVDVIKSAIVSFSKFNEKHNNRFMNQLNVLSAGYTNKLAGKEARKIELNINSPIGQLVAHANEVNYNKE